MRLRTARRSNIGNSVVRRWRTWKVAEGYASACSPDSLEILRCIEGTQSERKAVLQTTPHVRGVTVPQRWTIPPGLYRVQLRSVRW